MRKDVIHADVTRSIYSLIRKKGDVTVFECRVQHGTASVNERETVACRDTLLFAGRENRIAVTVRNQKGSPVQGKCEILTLPRLAGEDQGQIQWWGGIVNLRATNKGPVERPALPPSLPRDASWIDGIAFGCRFHPGE